MFHIFIELKVQRRKSSRFQRSCMDQIATLRIIAEQSLEWNSAPNVNFIDFEKTFDSLGRESLWKLPRHYGVPEIVIIIRSSYSCISIRVIHEGKTNETFNVLTGVRPGCLLSHFPFLLAVDWMIQQTTARNRNDIQGRSVHNWMTYRLRR